MLQSIFFYETGPIVLNLIKKLLFDCALLSLYGNVSALKEELQVAIDIGSVKAAHMVFLSMSEFIPVM